MAKQVRVYGVEKAKGWDVLNAKQQSSGTFPKTVHAVHIAWGDGKGNKAAKMELAQFLAAYRHIEGCYWEAV